VREPASKRRYTIVRITTRSGLEGFGECHSLTVEDITKARSYLPGKPGTAYEVIARELAAFRHLRAAVDMALLDVAGKAAKAPVYQVLGGPTRSKARALAILSGESGEALTASMKQAAERGFRAFSVSVPRPIHGAHALLEKLRATGSEQADFVLDGGAALPSGEAGAVARAVERLHPLWFEEPCSTANLKAVRKIADETVVPLGFGRSLQDGSAFQDLLREEAVDILRPDLGACGVSQIRRIAALAEAYYVAVAPFHDGGPIATAAALHLAASLPNFFIQQVPTPPDEKDRRMRSELVKEPVETVKNGFLSLPSGPGLGITVNLEALKRYREDA
jgi:galactonate dehydratase